MSEDIHDYNQKLENIEARIKEADNERLSEEDKELLLDFKNYLFSINLSGTRVWRYLSGLWSISQWKSGSFGELGRGELEEIVSNINQKQYSAHTKQTYRVILKKFYQWLKGDPSSDKYPDIVDWINTTLEHNGKKLPEEILTKDEVKAMIRNANNTRDKALISTLYESGCRIGELLPIEWKHIDFSVEEGMKLRVDGKTGTRRILLVSSKPHLSAWKAEYPKEVKDDNRVWVNLHYGSKSSYGEPLNYSSVRMMLKRTAKRAGVDKKVNPHAFRHARATHLANHLTEAQMCEYFGWVQGSDQPSNYVHLSGRDLDNAIKEVYGLKEREEEKDKFDIRECPECGYENTPEKNVCKECGYSFGASQEDRLMQKIEENPDKWGEVLLKAMKKVEN